LGRRRASGGAAAGTPIGLPYRLLGALALQSHASLLARVVVMPAFIAGSPDRDNGATTAAGWHPLYPSSG
jgi:hypothetical protein